MATKQKVVIKVYNMKNDQKKSTSISLSIFGGNSDARSRAMSAAVSVSGVESASLQGPDKDELVVTGEGIDSVHLTTLLRKTMGRAELLTVGPVEDKKNTDPKPTSTSTTTAEGPVLLSTQPYYYSHYYNYNNGGLPLQVYPVPDTDPSCSIM